MGRNQLPDHRRARPQARTPLAVLKIWVDAHGVHAGDSYWKPGHEGPAFDPENWLRDRSSGEFDEEDIGALAVPPPTALELSEALRTHFRFLADLDAQERVLAQAREQDRHIALAALPGGRLTNAGLYRPTATQGSGADQTGRPADGTDPASTSTDTVSATRGGASGPPPCSQT
ncbi:hypothetical protein GCM10022223_08990 [Kineosporia mesophila]|uniref:Uncharacterized protein n=1 Tax=Kineosporia mesophila TaxID=566012 RepID=A0ABP6Z5F7_9ACTN